jgi:hypothetical protein
VTPSDDLPLHDLPARIARLERLLDGLESARRTGTGGGAAADTAGLSATDRLRDVAAVLERRASLAEYDGGDAIAMRALLEEFRLMTASLRAMAEDIGGRLGEASTAVDDSHARLNALEEME